MAVMMISFCLGMMIANLNTRSRIALVNVPSGVVEKKQQQEVLVVTSGQQNENEHALHGGDDFDFVSQSSSFVVHNLQFIDVTYLILI